MRRGRAAQRSPILYPIAAGRETAAANRPAATLDGAAMRAL